ncbi:hypothetical protein ACIP98_28820 [Streptomyces sp. NPDC088354]|uniref:hypothetical protein n=1 Tax=Streptomyces sp. NPDC088354 TaxID=3365856 RepID=UPI003818D322
MSQRSDSPPSPWTSSSLKAARHRGTVAAFLRAAASLAVLAALLGGLPVLLWWGTAIVAPAGVQVLGNLLSTQDSGQVFLLALAVAGWAGWAGFAAAVAVEIPAQLRGRTAPRVRLLVGQRTAATLVGAILVALPTGTALASPAPAHAVTVTAAATAHAPASAGAEPHSVLRGDVKGKDGARTHVVRAVRPAESLWSIAETRLGDGNRWEEIARLNTGATMTDGTTFRAEDPIRPGWVLLLPDDAATDGARLHAYGGRGSALEESTHQEYTVRAGDSLSQIAEDKLGDADRYPVIFRLNQGEAQPGGGHFTDSDLIFPGQHLDLPAPRGVQHTGTGPAAPHEETATPRTPSNGEHGHAGPGQHPPSARPSASQGGTGRAAQAPDPSPSLTRSPTRTPSPATPTAPRSLPAHNPSAPHAAPSRDDVARSPQVRAPQAVPEVGSSSRDPGHESPRSDVPSATVSASPQQSSPSPAAAVPVPARSAGAVQDNGGERQVVLVAGIGALLAASLAGALGVRRILQQRRRRAGETIAIDADPTRTEQVLHTAGEPAGVALLDTVLRTLAHHASESGRDVPAVRGARLTAGGAISLVLDDPEAEPIAPFTAGDSGGVWVLDALSPLLPAEQARDVPAPYPGLVTIGAAGNGDLVLVDLFRTRGLLLDGTPDDVLAVARALALEAGTSAWSDYTEVLTVGLGTRLAGLLPKGRLRAMPHLPAVVADLGALLVEVHQNTADQAVEPLPWILICAADVDPEEAWQLADAVAAARHLPVTVVLPDTAATRQAFPDADTLHAGEDAQASLAQLTADPIEVQRLTDEQYREFVHALDVADQPSDQARGTWQLAEDHDRAATAPRAAPHPLLLHHGTDGDLSQADAGSPFPALLSTAGPAIRLVRDSTEPTEPSGPTDQGGTASEVAVEPSPPEEADPGAPRINVLGPLEVSGITGAGHGAKVAALAALIYLKPGRNADTLCTAMDPASPWSTRTLQSRLSDLRARFGTNAQGEPYLPRPKAGYAFHPAVRSDWADFQQAATRALAAGPVAGLAGLEEALAMVRGRPFDGQEQPWAASVQQEILSRIVDVAHTLATWHTTGDTPDLDAARAAVLRGLDIDETAEVLYRDWMAIEHTAGSISGVRRAIAQVQQVTRAYDISMDPRTEYAITEVLESEDLAAANHGL